MTATSLSRVSKYALAALFAAACSNTAPTPGPGVGSVTGAPATTTAAPAPSATASGAGEPASSSSAHPKAPVNLTIATNTQATIEDVRIGAGNFWEDEWDEGGQKRKGQTAMLWIYLRDDASKNDKLRVHPGSTFKAGRFAFVVTGVDAAEVQLRVSE